MHPVVKSEGGNRVTWSIGIYTVVKSEETPMHRSRSVDLNLNEKTRSTFVFAKVDNGDLVFMTDDFGWWNAQCDEVCM